jgi:hypothetical protein
MMFGGGVDIGHGLVAWRLAQADWLITRFSGFTNKNNVRVSTGLVVRLARQVSLGFNTRAAFSMSSLVKAGAQTN